MTGPQDSAERHGPGPAPRDLEISRDHLWPAAIVIGLAVVVAVNILFIYVAVREADPVVPSYVTERR